MSDSSRWVLAFDGSCAACATISHTVERASDRKLEVLPLTHPDVLRWREERMGVEAPWVPTLIRVRGPKVKTWTGATMGVRLAAMLGPGATMRVLSALGELPHRQQQADAQPASRSSLVMGRKRFLQLGAGIAVAAGLTVTGRTPAFAQSETSRARAWVQANLDRLPEHYSEITRYPMEYRRAIFSKLSPSARSRFWLEHLGRYRAGHPDLSPEQHRVLNQAVDTFSDEAVFQDLRQAGVDQRLTALAEAAVAAFGETEAAALVATLGPGEPARSTTAMVPDCECSTSNDWCKVWSSGSRCYTVRCPGWYGCGTGGIYWCNGYCS
ncbi:bacteriocin fulvocin C-related protein [Micromonospora zhanjiangensis]|uniref:Bacteriocin fulvocin C-related protein n=1 Tax=Micromonospora zhanjiangensis TaxID=1522057 RepID=A0ABV8KWG8_9ACTN